VITPHRPVFVDAGAWIALADRGDNLHVAARERHQRLLSERRPLVTTNLVMAEAYVLIQRSAGHGAAVRFLDALRSTSRLTIVYATSDHHAEAEAILRRFTDQDFSLADAVSFAVMQAGGIEEALGFDAHFLTAGFVLIGD
jgi:predicted nucleic acid-binding protein